MIWGGMALACATNALRELSRRRYDIYSALSRAIVAASLAATHAGSTFGMQDTGRHIEKSVVLPNADISAFAAAHRHHKYERAYRLSNAAGRLPAICHSFSSQ